MAITKDAGRQWPLVAKVPFTYADFDTSGVAVAALDLPGNATVIGGELVVETVFNSGTSDALDVGDGASATRYAGAVDGQAAARTALTLTGYKHTVPDTVDIEWTGAGTAPTQGAGYLLVMYTVDDKANEVQPD